VEDDFEVLRCVYGCADVWECERARCGSVDALMRLPCAFLAPSMHRGHTDTHARTHAHTRMVGSHRKNAENCEIKPLYHLC
jgi:hypothetical protein